MPLVNINTSSNTPTDTPPRIHTPEFRGVSIDTEVIPEIALITHIQGSPYSVSYYSQIISEDSGTSGVGAGLSSVHQQYRKINDMVLMVTSELSYNQDTETKDGTYVGSATIYPFLIPNEGDHFAAELGNGRRGIFEITSTRRLSVYKQACHEVDFKLVRDATATAISELEQKTIQVFYYDKNFLDHGQNPLLFEEEYTLVNELRRRYYIAVRNYIGMFFSREYSTILVGGQTDTTYDPKVVRFLLHLLSVSESPELSYIKQLNTDIDPGLSSMSLWDALMSRQDIIPRVYTQVGLVDTSNFSVNPSLESIKYSGINQVVYPIDMMTSVDMSHGYAPMIPTRSLDSLDRSMRMRNGSFQPIGSLNIDYLINPVDLPGYDNSQETVLHPSNRVLYHPIDPSGTYVLSGYFYRNNPSDTQHQSQLEVQIYNFIYNRQIDIRIIRRLLDSSEQMKPLEQFYLIPLILLLLRQRIFITT